MKIAFIGGGNMATALIAGLVQDGNTRVHVVDPKPEALEQLAARYGATTSSSIDDAVSACDVVVLAVKPQQMREVAGALAPHLASGKPANGQLILSIAAGIRGADLARWLNGHQAIVRAMPNTPALIRQGVTGLVALAGVSEAQRAAADRVLSAVGQTVWLDDEALIDPVTAVSGSGPAYVFYFLEAMVAAAQEMGLSAEQGRKLALATFSGATQLAAQSGESLEVLRQRVTSKGGTTHAAIASMEAAGVKEAVGAAMKAAAARGRELGEELGKD